MDLDKIPNKRLLNLRLACEDYNFSTRYVAGGKGIHYLIDQLSRHPQPIDREYDVINLCVQNSLLSTNPDNPDPLLNELREKAKTCSQFIVHSSTVAAKAVQALGDPIPATLHKPRW